MNKQMEKPKFKTVKCDYCNSHSFTKIFSAKDNYNQLPGLFTIVKCDKCGLIYTNPRPIQKDMAFYYPKTAGYFSPQKPKEKIGFKQNIKKFLLQEYYDYFTKKKRNIFFKLILFPLYLYTYCPMKISGYPKFVKNGKLLDIGCSYGGFLYYMKNLGWEVRGIEMNKDMVEWGNKNFNIDILNADIDSFHTDEKFDVITMRMVLEHVYFPKKSLQKVKKMLKPNGQLIIIIPDINGFESKLYKKYAYTLQLPTHLTHFSSITIRNYLNNLNMGDIKIYHQLTDRDLIAPLDYMQRDGIKTKFLLKLISNKIIRKTIIKNFIRILSIFGKTSRMTIYARKQ